MTVTWMISQDGTTRGDVVVSSATGRPVLLDNEKKLAQDIRQGFGQESDPEGYGSDLRSLIGVVADEYALRAEISRRVRDTVRSIQDLQARFHVTSRTAGERLASVTRLRVGQVTDVAGASAKTAYAFRMDVTSAANTTIPLGGTVRQ